jgi:hypothetical protein
VVVYCLLRYKLASVEQELQALYLPGALEGVWPRRAIEALVFFALSFYLLHLLLRLFRNIMEIRKDAKQKELRRCEQRHTEVMEDPGLSLREKEDTGLKLEQRWKLIDDQPEDGLFYRKASGFIKFVFGLLTGAAGIAGLVLRFYKI